jgi:hypothetical protein
MRTFLLLILSAAVAQAVIIPTNRRITWQDNVGISGGIPAVTTVYQNYSTAPTEATLQSAINSCPSNQVITLGDWTNTYTTDLNIQTSGCVVRGTTNANGFPKTRLIFTGGKVQLRSSGFNDNNLTTSVNLSVDAHLGDTTLTFAATPTWITPGELYVLDELDDATLINGIGEQGGQSYRQIKGQGARGRAQTVLVTAKGVTTVTLQLPINEDFRVSQTAQLAQYPTTSSLKRAGIEDVYLEFQYGSSGTEAMNFYGTQECWLKNVYSDNAPGTYHVWSIFCYRPEIRHCYYKNAHFLGGGQGYGITLYHYTSYGLFEDNIVTNLHCGCTVNYGSSGNVFGYNYFGGGVSDANQNPGISAHGVSTWKCLFEGNWSYNKLLFDFTHGSGGTRHTVFRNRILGLSRSGIGDQVPMSIERYNRQQNIIGNLLGVSGIHNNVYRWSAPVSCTGSNAIIREGYFLNVNCDSSSFDSETTLTNIYHGNYDVFTASPGINWDLSIADHSLPDSYYRTTKPSFFANRPWPPFDPSSTNAAAMDPTNIPAGFRYAYGFDPPSGSASSSGTLPTRPRTRATRAGVFR